MNPATIQKIEWIKPIENADLIEECGVLGWSCVVKKGEFNVGDSVVYIEIDSVVPETPEFEFLRIRHFRVRTIRLKGVLSQGLVLPISILPTGEYNIGDDVSELLNITHYEKPIPAQLSGQVKGNFPTHIVRKTDEERIQNCPGVLEELSGVEVYGTVKLNGTSGTYIFHNDEFYVCSRNLSFKLDDINKDNVYLRIAEKYNIEEKLKSVGNVSVQGEIVGPGIQKNQLGLNEIDFYVFNVYDINERRYLPFSELASFCNKHQLKMVPVDDIFTFNHTIEQLLEMANGLYTGTKNKREGIVIRPVKEMYRRVLKVRMSFKILSNSYLLSEKE